MGHYLDMFKSNLDSQSEKNIFYLRNELASFYGMTNFVEHLGHVSSKAVSRSKIHGAKKKKQMLAISNIGKVGNIAWLYHRSLKKTGSSFCHKTAKQLLP